MITNAQNLKLYMSGESGANASVKVERMTGGYIAPAELRFIPTTKVSNENCYYLFDDNHERIRMRDLAGSNNPETPTTIAHFENLSPGVYTFFGYHNKDENYPENMELYYDPVFWNTNGNATVEITKVGYSTNWKWNQVWADFSGKNVHAPEVYYGQLGSDSVLENFIADPYSDSTHSVNAGQKLWFSDIIGSNRFSSMKEGTVVWVLFEFRVTGGTVNFDTLAYSDLSHKNTIQLSSIKKGDYEYDEQYKGKAYSAPRVSANLEYFIDGSTISEETILPVRVFNQFFTEGHTMESGIFTTNTNSYSRQGVQSGNWHTADDSNMMKFVYKDSDGTEWLFDNFHDDQTNELLSVPSDGPASGVSAGNFANYGVTNSYTITIHNTGNRDIYFKHKIASEGQHVYTRKVYCNNVFSSENSTDIQLFKKAYVDIVYLTEENLADVVVPSNTTAVIKIDLTMTTGCNGTIHNYLSVY